MERPAVRHSIPSRVESRGRENHANCYFRSSVKAELVVAVEAGPPLHRHKKVQATRGVEAAVAEGAVGLGKVGGLRGAGKGGTGRGGRCFEVRCGACEQRTREATRRTMALRLA